MRTNISTSAFYEVLEQRNLLVSMESVVEAFGRCLDTDISGETLEIEPRSGITHRSPPEPIDQDAAETMKLLHQRGASFHEPSKT